MLKDKETNEIISKNIKKARQSKKMTQEKLAEKCNISTQFIREIESKKKGGSINTLINICIALDISPNELFYDFFEDNLKENEKLMSQINRLSQRDKEIIMGILDKMI